MKERKEIYNVADGTDKRTGYRQQKKIRHQRNATTKIKVGMAIFYRSVSGQTEYHLAGHDVYVYWSGNNGIRQCI